MLNTASWSTAAKLSYSISQNVKKRGRESFIDIPKRMSYNPRMPRRPRLATGGLVYHVLNRRVGRLKLFNRPADYAAFESILAESYHRTGIRITAYCLMPTHWHLLLWPRQDGELSEVVRWITVTHTQRWHVHRRTSGTGPVYQGRFKSFPVQTDEHFLTVARYIERNPLRAALVNHAEDWQWSSLWRRMQDDSKLTAWLSQWPVVQPRNWVRRVNQPETEEELEMLRVSVNRGRPFGNEPWAVRTAKRCGLESTLRPPGRPRGS
jgi:putative transposase